MTCDLFIYIFVFVYKTLLYIYVCIFLWYSQFKSQSISIKGDETHCSNCFISCKRNYLIISIGIYCLYFKHRPPVGSLSLEKQILERTSNFLLFINFTDSKIQTLSPKTRVVYQPQPCRFQRYHLLCRPPYHTSVFVCSLSSAPYS